MRWQLYYELGSWFGVAEDDKYTYETFSQASPERVAMAIENGDFSMESKSLDNEELNV